MGWKLINNSKVIKLLSRDLNDKVLSDLFKDGVLLVNSNKRVTISFVTNNVFNVFNKIKSKGIQPLFIGLPVCDTNDFKQARIALPFAKLINSNSIVKVIISLKAEQLFLYGRDIWSSSIIDVVGTPQRRGLVFVFNADNVFLGLAFALVDDLLSKGDKVVLKNVIDIGYYLRCER